MSPSRELEPIGVHQRTRTDLLHPVRSRSARGGRPRGRRRHRSNAREQVSELPTRRRRRATRRTLNERASTTAHAPRRRSVVHSPTHIPHADARIARGRATARRSIPLAIRRTLSHNRDEFKNSEQRRRACDTQALSNSEDGGEERAAMPATSQTPKRQLTRFEARFFWRGAASAFSNSIERAHRTTMSQASKREVPRVCEMASIRRKKADEYFSCRLRTDKVFVYFTRLKMCVYKGAVFLKRAHRRNDRDHGIQIHKDMHKTKPFLFNRLS